MDPKNIRNIAIIAHVDHGKTTLVDHLLKQSGTFRQNEQVDERFMDSMDLEKERGITIAAKNASFVYNGVKVNIVDTPGHSDFGGEVERILDMVDGAILLVDASEGPLPQTRFVLRKAIEQGLRILVCINKIDRHDARASEVLNEVFDLFIELGASEEQTDFDVVYTVAKEGVAVKDPADRASGRDFKLLLDWIVEKFPPPKVSDSPHLQLLVANIGYNEFVGKLGIGRIRSGSIRVGQEVLAFHENGQEKFKVNALFTFKTSQQVPIQEAGAGDICVVAGMKDIFIGDTLTSPENPLPMKRLRVEEPTVGAMLMVNDSPFSGRDGKLVTSRQIKERLEKELLYNVAIRVEQTPSTDTWKILCRGELQLAILVEQMRREGFEVMVSKPQVIFKQEGETQLEPIERAIIDIESEYSGIVTRKLGERKGILMAMDNKGGSRTRLEFLIPSRGLIGYRSEFLTDTRGTGLLNTQFEGYEAFKGEIPSRSTGALVSDRKGVATAYALWNLEDRGPMFIDPGTEVYEGMIVGESMNGIDMVVNVCREKKLTNVRASGSDEAIRLTPPIKMNLERAMEWINEEELVEVTPHHIRICQRRGH